MDIRRRDFLTATAATLIFGGPALTRPLAPNAAQNGISFLTIGDWGNTKFHADAARVAEAMARVADERHVQFVLAVGDNFYPAGVSSVDDPLWQSAFEDVYFQKTLDVPWHVVLGNHDYKGDVQAQIDYSRRSNRWMLPKPYYILHQRSQNVTADFFFLDTNPMAEMKWWERVVWSAPQVEAQLQWLENQLAASTAYWKIVVGHHPVFSGGSHGNTPILVERLPPLFKRHNVQLYLNGHDHDLQHIQQDGTNYLTSGAAASSRDTHSIEGTQFAQSKLGFLHTRLDRTTATLTFIGADGAILYETVIDHGSEDAATLYP